MLPQNTGFNLKIIISIYINFEWVTKTKNQKNMDFIIQSIRHFMQSHHKSNTIWWLNLPGFSNKVIRLNSMGQHQHSKIWIWVKLYNKLKEKTQKIKEMNRVMIIFDSTIIYLYYFLDLDFTIFYTYWIYINFENK